MRDYFSKEITATTQASIQPKRNYFAEEILSTKPKIDYFAQEIASPETPQEQPFSMFKETMRNLPSAIGQTLPETARGLLETSEQVAGELSRPLIYASTVGEQIRKGGIKNIREAIPFARGLTGLEKSSVAKSMKDIAKLEITGKKGVAGLIQDATVFAAETGLEFYLRPEYLLGGLLAGKLIGLGTTAIMKGATHLPKSLQNILFKDIGSKFGKRTALEIADAQTKQGGALKWIERNKAKGGKYAERANELEKYLTKKSGIVQPKTAVFEKGQFIKPEGTIKSAAGSKMVDAQGRTVYEWDKTFKEYRRVITQAGKAPKIVEVTGTQQIKAGEQKVTIPYKEKVTLTRAQEIAGKKAPITTPTVKAPVVKGGEERSVIGKWNRIQRQSKGLSDKGKEITIDNELSREKLDQQSNMEYRLKRAGANEQEINAGEITVYRATEEGKILEGDYVTPNKSATKPYLEQRIETGRKPEIISKKVKVSDLLIGDEPTDFVYAPVKPTQVSIEQEAIPKELEPLAKEARKYKSAEEFVKNYDGGLILDRAKVNNWIAGGPDNTVPISELLGTEGKKIMKEMELPDLPVRVQEASEETIGHYAQIEWRGGNKLKDARINIEISPTEEFGVENLASREVDLLHELAHAKQITLNRLGKKKIQGEISEQAAQKHANYIFNQTKAQLTSIYNKATSKVEKVVGKELEQKVYTSGDEIIKKFDKPIIEAGKTKNRELIDKLYKQQTQLLKKQYKPITDNVDDVNVIFESTCVDCKGGGEFVDAQVEKAIEVSKRGKWGNKIKEQWQYAKGKNRLNEYDTELLLNDEYLIFRESAIENFYKLEGIDIYNKAKVGKIDKPAEVVKPKIEPIKKYKTQLTEIKGEIISGEAGYRMPIGEEKEEWIGISSTYPEYFKNKGWTKKQVVNIIDKAQTEKPLTTKQQGILDELVEVAKEKRINLANQIRADRDIQRSQEGVLSDEELDSIIKEPKQEEDIFKYIAKEEAGFIKIPSYQPIVNLYNRVHDWIFTFGEARRTDPALYDKLMESYGRRNAGIERAVNVVENIVGNRISTKDAVKLSLVYEDKRLSPSKELKPIYDKFNNLLTNLQKREIAEGIFKRPFQERMLEENEAKLEIAKAKSDYKTMRELSAENTKIKNMRYLPHNVVVQRAIEAKLAKIEGVERKAFLDKLSRVSYQFRMRKGRGFLVDYIKSGLLKPEDADIRKLTAEALSSYYHRSSLKSLFDYAKSQELIKPTSEKLKMQGWLNQRQIGIVSPELKNKLIHPLLATSLTEMKTMKQGMGGGLGRRILGTIKIGQFIKPQIIWNYNAVQKYMRGIYNLDPTREAKDLAEAYKAVVGKTELYHKLNESNLYQFPYEVSRTSRDEQIKLMIRKTSEEIPNYVKLLERITNTSWAKSDIDIKNTLMVAYQALAKATWFGDKVQRTQSYLTLKNMGYPHDEAVKVASRSHGAYSILSEKYKKALSPITFVYSFRLLMPMEIAKIVTEPVMGIANAIFKREKIPKYKAKRWTKSLIAAILIPVLIDSYMKARGFKKEGVHLGSLAWKWKKDIEVDGKKSEIVVGMNYILNMPIKYMQRATYYNPIRPQNRIQQATSNLIKWEIHPLGRIFFWDLKENRRSFGSGAYVYDANAHWIKQTGQIASYVFGQSFRFWGGIMDAMGEANLSQKEKNEQEKIFNENLSNLDRVLFSVFGYKYTRQNLPDRKAIMRRYLEKEWFKRGSTISRKYEGERKEKQLRELEKWKVRCMGWINNDMR